MNRYQVSYSITLHQYVVWDSQENKIVVRLHNDHNARSLAKLYNQKEVKALELTHKREEEKSHG